MSSTRAPGMCCDCSVRPCTPSDLGNAAEVYPRRSDCKRRILAGGRRSQARGWSWGRATRKESRLAARGCSIARDSDKRPHSLPRLALSSLSHCQPRSQSSPSHDKFFTHVRGWYLVDSHIRYRRTGEHASSCRNSRCAQEIPSPVCGALAMDISTRSTSQTYLYGLCGCYASAKTWYVPYVVLPLIYSNS